MIHVVSRRVSCRRSHAVLARLDGTGVEVVDDERHINDPALATEAADRLHQMIQKGRR